MSTLASIQITAGPRCEYEIFLFILAPTNPTSLGLRRFVKQDARADSFFRLLVGPFVYTYRRNTSRRGNSTLNEMRAIEVYLYQPWIDPDPYPLVGASSAYRNDLNLGYRNSELKACQRFILCKKTTLPAVRFKPVLHIIIAPLSHLPIDLSGAPGQTYHLLYFHIGRLRQLAPNHSLASSTHLL